jgi:hypothetical protein
MSPGGVRAFVLARQMGLKAAAVLAAGRILGIEVRTPPSEVSAADRASLEAYFRDVGCPVGGVTAAWARQRCGEGRGAE